MTSILVESYGSTKEGSALIGEPFVVRVFKWLV